MEIVIRENTINIRNNEDLFTDYYLNELVDLFINFI